MRALGVSRTSLAPGGVLAGPWVKNELWRRARAVPTLDLRFADNKSLTDSVTGQSLVTFTRASRGTYVDSDGVLRTAVTNLLLRSEEFDVSPWAVLFSASITADQATSPNGANTADLLQLSNTNVFSGTRQNFTFSASTTYTFSVYARSVSGTSAFRLKIFDGVSDTFSANLAATTTWQRFSLTVTVAAGAGAGNAAISNVAALSADSLYIWGAQLEESSTVGEYIPTTSTINSAPRFDHNPTTGESLGLLVEESRTNLLLRSEEFDDAGGWTSPVNSSLASNALSAPNGSVTSEKLVVNNLASTGYVQSTNFSTSLGFYCFSCFLKKGEFSTARLQLNSDIWEGVSSTARPNVVVDLNNGTVLSQARNSGYGILPLANGWYRVYLIAQCTTASVSNTLVGCNDTGDGTSGIYLWGAQLEAGAFPTSYIGPTTTAAVTRSADVASITGTALSGWYRQDEGTVFADVASIYNNGRYFMFDNGTTNERWEARYVTTLATGNSWSNNIQDVNINTFVTPASPASSVRIAFANASNNAAIASNGIGAQLGTDSSSTMPVSQSRFWIGSYQGIATYTNGPIRRLTYWPARLANNLLQQITL